MDTIQLLKKHGIKPKKGLGQNFLVDDFYLQKIADIANIQAQDTVLEIGAGAGNLTRFLAQKAGQVIAVEIDQALQPVLKEALNGFGNVVFVQADMLQIKPQELVASGGYLVVANIPYYITSALIRHLLEAPIKPRRLVLTVQQEVAERICAKPGKLSLLALSVQVYGNPAKVMNIPAGAFYPIPKVDSAVVDVALYPTPKIPCPDLDTFFSLAKTAFQQKRKMLHNALGGLPHIKKENTAALLIEAGIDSKRRAQTLTIAEWGELSRKYQVHIKQVT